MPGIEIKGRSKIANYRHGGRTGKFGGGRTNLLEELGRVEGERSNPNRRAEISRVHSELNRGYAKGGRAAFKHGSAEVEHGAEVKKKRKKSAGALKGRDPGREPRGTTRKWIRATPTMAAEGGRIGFKKGTDKKWMQKVSASIKKRGTKGKCTPITKPGCTGRAKALAKTFKKIAAKRKA